MAGLVDMIKRDAAGTRLDTVRVAVARDGWALDERTLTYLRAGRGSGLVWGGCDYERLRFTFDECRQLYFSSDYLVIRHPPDPETMPEFSRRLWEVLEEGEAPFLEVFPSLELGADDRLHLFRRRDL